MDTITGVVTHVQRKGHTIYGNQIIIVVIKDEEGQYYTHRISNNAGIVYEIENAEFKEYPHTFALTKAGRISKVIR